MAQDGTIKINTELDSSKAQSAMSKFSSVAKTALAGVTVAAGAVGTAMTAIAGYAIKVGSDFEAGMSKVSSISGATGADLEALTAKAEEMGSKTKFSATEAASAFEYMAMAGWKTEDMLSGIEGIMNLAAASGEDLATTSDIVTDALTAFGLSASDSGHFADVLAAASSNANTNVSMMGETFKYVAPVAGSLGFTAEDTAVAIGLMANSGIKAGQAGTSLRAMMSRLAKPTDEVQEAMDKLGVSITNSDGSMKSLNEIMLDLREGFSSLSESESASTAAALAGQEAMSGLLAIVGASDADFNKLKASIDGCDGATERMAETMQDNLQGSVTIFGSALEGFGIKIYEEIQEPLKDAVDTGTECVNRLAGAFESEGIRGAVSEAGEIFNELADDIASTSGAADKIVTPLKNMATAGANLGKTVLPAFADAVKITVENMDKLIPLAISGYTAFKSYASITKTVTAAKKAHAAATKILTLMEQKNLLQTAATSGELTLQQFLIGVHTGKITLATAATGLWAKAQTALNTAITANPLGLFAAAIAALCAGMAAYTLIIGDTTDKTYELSTAEKKTLEDCKKNTEALNEQREARAESISAIDAEYGRYESLLSELQSITDENGKVKTGYEDRARVITGELSEALGIEIEMLDGQIQKYGEVVDAIDQVITKKKAEAVLESMQEDIADAYQKTEEAMAEYKNAAGVAADANKKVNQAVIEQYEAQRLYDKAVREGSSDVEDYARRLQTAKQNTDRAKAAQREATEEAEESKKAMEELSAEVDNYNALMEAVASGDAARIESALNDLVTSYHSYTQEALAESEDTRKALYDQANDYVENLGLIQDGTIQVADEIYGQMADAAAKTIENFNQLPGGVAQGIEDIGPEASAAMISALAQADLDGKLSEEGKAAVESFISGFQGLEPETQEAFSQAWYGALKGLEGFEELEDPAKEGADAFLKSLTAALEVHSPSRAVADIFENVWPGAAEGLESGKDDLNEKGKGIVQNFLESLGGENLGEKAKKAGSDIMSFFGVGVSSKTEDSYAAGKSNAEAANSGAGEVNPLSTGTHFSGLLGSGISKMVAVLFKDGKSLSDNAKSGAGSVNPTDTGQSFGSRYASGVGSKTGEANAKGKALADNAKSGAGSVDGYKPGEDFGKGFVDGIGSFLGKAAEAAANLAKSAYDALRGALDEHSPSRKSKKSGKNFDIGLGLGVSENEDYAINAAEELGENVLDALDMSAWNERIKGIDVSGIMERVNLAADEKRSRVSDKVIAGVVAKEQVNNTSRGKDNVFEFDYKRLGKEISKRPVVAVLNMDGREVTRILAIPMEQQFEEDAKLMSMLKGEWQ